MKRSPLSRGATHDENGRKRYSTFASAGGGLKRSAPTGFAWLPGHLVEVSPEALAAGLT